MPPVCFSCTWQCVLNSRFSGRRARARPWLAWGACVPLLCSLGRLRAPNLPEDEGSSPLKVLQAGFLPGPGPAPGPSKGPSVSSLPGCPSPPLQLWTQAADRVCLGGAVLRASHGGHVPAGPPAHPVAPLPAPSKYSAQGAGGCSPHPTPMLPSGACVLPEAMEGVSAHHTPNVFFLNKGKKRISPETCAASGAVGSWWSQTSHLQHIQITRGLPWAPPGAAKSVGSPPHPLNRESCRLPGPRDATQNGPAGSAQGGVLLPQPTLAPPIQ